MTPGWLFWGVIFGAVGMGMFVYGKKQQSAVPLVCGIVLMVFPYFVSNLLLLVAIGVVVCAIPWILRG
ncbi:MAG: hypothetical protein U0X73_05790 [Thermoanaerobaculia bacterium]